MKLSYNLPRTEPQVFVSDSHRFENNRIARRHFEVLERHPLLLGDWRDFLFLNFRVPAAVLQREVPFPLDLFEGEAYVSLVAFTMRRLRPAFGGKLTEALFLPLRTTRFLNVRTYVKHQGETAIYFMREYISNRLSEPLGPLAYGLPYHFATMRYNCDQPSTYEGMLERGPDQRLAFAAERRDTRHLRPPTPGSLEHFLTERYTAFTSHGGTPRLFRIWHEPWELGEANANIVDDSLLRAAGDWYAQATPAAAFHSPGVNDVWMGRPHRVPREGHHHGCACFYELP